MYVSSVKCYTKDMLKRAGGITNTLVWPLFVSSMLSVVLFICRMLGGHTTRYWFLLWNLLLAWLPLLFAYALSWRALLLTFLWLVFLPNSFYLMSDFIHLTPTGEVSLLFDAVLFTSFVWNGLLLGFTSVFLVQSQLSRRVEKRLCVLLISLVFIVCSFAIYLGRYLALNTWDIFVNPGGILFDLSDRIIKPGSHISMFTVTTLFSVTLGAMYYTVAKLVSFIRGERKES
jgi:uncharacterized membrane protein